jgi:hypothetical protein
LPNFKISLLPTDSVILDHTVLIMVEKKKECKKAPEKNLGIIIWSFQYGTGQDSLAGAEQAIKNGPGT